ncbi:transmembrane protein 209-like isoform X2 [Pocillopora verrucosa]
MQRRILKSESPIIERSYQRKQMTKRSHAAFTWVFVNVILAAIFFTELVFGSVAEYFEFEHPLVWFVVCGLAIWFTFCFIVDLYHYMRPVLGQNSVVLSLDQRKLLGIQPTDSGFKLAPPESPTSHGSAVSPSIIPSTSSPAMIMTTTITRTPPRPHGTPPRSNSSSPRSPIMGTPSFYNETVSSPDTRSRHSSPGRSPFPSSDHMTDLNSLEQYLREQQQEEGRLHRVASSDALTPGRGQSFWSGYRHDFTPPLSVYRIARRSPDLSSSRDDDDAGYNSTKADEIWTQYAVTRTDLDHWIENCRKWLCQTILCRLVEQIEAVNETLCRIGCSELQVGTISLSAARQVAVTKADQAPTLRAIIPYLEASNNQEYLVKRLSELAQGGCMGLYRWNCGGQYRGKSWEQDLLADSQLLLHMFCTYMDSRLPADPTFPDGRTFTGLHFLKTPDKPNARKSDLCIYQSRLHPPHFKVIIEDEVYDMPKGQNNLFHTIVFFLHHVKTKQYGMLGRVNLGMSGVNILCILNMK